MSGKSGEFHAEHENASSRARKSRTAAATTRQGKASAAARDVMDVEDDDGVHIAGVEHDRDLEPGNAEDPDA